MKQKDTMQPLISVIVPVYNGEEYLAKCIESIENQTYENLEVIIINDGSTDATGQVCVSLKKRYPNIHVITMEDEGVSAARNAGLDAAKGAFVTFVDADDRLRSRMLEALFYGIMKTGSDICGCSFYMWHTQEEWDMFLTQKYRMEEAKVYRATDYLREETLKGNSRCWSKLYRRSVIGKMRFRKGMSIGEDMLFLIDLLPYVRSVSEISYPGYGYYQNPHGAMNRAFTKRYMDQITCWEIAREQSVKIDKSLYGQVTAILLISIMLTVGKLAFLSGSERRKYSECVQICHHKLKEEIEVKEAYEALSKGYRIKTKMFCLAPNLYLFLYHFRKYIK